MCVCVCVRSLKRIVLKVICVKVELKCCLIKIVECSRIGIKCFGRCSYNGYFHVKIKTDEQELKMLFV